MIGIFGGTFDPIHHGHLRTALDVLEALRLEELRFIPLGRAVHRQQPLTSATKRLAMLRVAIEDSPGLVIDERELRRDAPSYTVDTLESLRDELGTETPLCLLLGRDAFNTFPGWREPTRILELAHLVVMERPGYQASNAPDLQSLAAGRVTQRGKDLHHRPSGHILHQKVTRLDISSSDIRQRLRDGRSIRYLLPEKARALLEAQT